MPSHDVPPGGPNPVSGESETRYAPALFSLTGDGRIARASLALARLVGARTEDLVGTALGEHLNPLDADALQDGIFDLQSGSESTGWEATLLRRDGSRMRVRIDVLGGDEPFAASLTPVTGAAVVSRLARNRAMLDALPSPVFISDPNGKPLHSNAAFRMRFGRPMIAGTGGISLIHAEDRSRFVEAWQEAILARIPLVHEMRMARFGEPFRWMRQESRPHHDDTGNVLFWVSNLTDIEEERASGTALVEARRFIARFGETSPDIIFLFDMDESRVHYCSAASIRVLGYTPDEMCAMGSAMLPTVVHPDDLSTITTDLARALEGDEDDGEEKTVEYRALRKDGETIWLSTRSQTFERHEDGRPKVVIGISQDVTQRRRVEIEREDHTRILEHALSGVSVLDREGRYLYANAEYAGVAGRAPADFVGRPWSDCVHAEDIERMKREHARMQVTGRVEAVCRGVRPDGAIYHKHVVMIPKYDRETFAGHYQFVRDVTERVRFQEQLEGQLAHISSVTAELELRSEELERANAILAQQAGSDGLTSLANHRVLQETLQTLNEAGRPHSLLLFDVDHFKAYNDAFGHPAGDVVLREFGVVLSAMTGRGELAARYGGEEFALVLPDVDLEGAEVRAELVLQRLGETAWPHRTITASVGCAIWSPGRSRADLIEAADRALYVSKRNGRNRVTAAA